MQASPRPPFRPFPPALPSDVHVDGTPAGLGRLARWHIEHAEEWQRFLRVPDHDVEDILQDAFVVLLTKAETLGPEVLDSWLRGVVRNKAKHYARAVAIASKLEPLLRAKLESHSSPILAPDAALLRRQAVFAVFWLVEQVEECRREVAERHVFADEPLPQIARSLGEPPGTVNARWEFAKADMRAAVERERRKQGAARWLVMLAALIENLWLWLGVGGRRRRDAVAALDERAAGLPVGARHEGQKSADRAGHRRSWVAALIACALLPLALIAHEASRPMAVHATAFAASGPSVVRSLALARWLPPRAHGEQRATPDGALSADTSSPSADGGQAREKSPRVPLPAKARPAASGQKAPALKSLTSAELDMARHLLVVATTSHQAGRFAIAEAALEQYRRMFPENPYPQIYTRAVSAQRSR